MTDHAAPIAEARWIERTTRESTVFPVARAVASLVELADALESLQAENGRLRKALTATPCDFVRRGDHNDCAHAGGGRGARDAWCVRCAALAPSEETP